MPVQNKTTTGGVSSRTCSRARTRCTLSRDVRPLVCLLLIQSIFRVTRLWRFLRLVQVKYKSSTTSSCDRAQPQG
eukprot:4976838-Prymnesium_polylepis.1